MSGFQGQANPWSGNNDYNADAFMIEQMINGRSFMKLVKIMAVTSAGAIAPAGTVDVMPLVNQIDGQGNSMPHGTVYKLIYFRMQGGANAVIMDPVVGDIGWAAIEDRDTSAVRATKGQANPGSRRKNDLADGVYVGGVLNGTPTQYIVFNAGGVSIVTPQNLTIQAQNVTLDSSGNLSVKGEITAKAGTGNSVDMTQHRHGTGMNAAGTVVPTPGT